MKKTHKINLKTASIKLIVFTILMFFLIPFLNSQNTNYEAMAQTVKPGGTYTLLEPLPCSDNEAGCQNGKTLKSVKIDADSNEFNLYINRLFKLAISIAGVMAMVMIFWGGVEYATTDAIDGKKAGRAKIQNALIGLLLALTSYIILYTIDPRYVQFKNDIIPPINISVTNSIVGYDKEDASKFLTTNVITNSVSRIDAEKEANDAEKAYIYAKNAYSNADDKEKPALWPKVQQAEAELAKKRLEQATERAKGAALFGLRDANATKIELGANKDSLDLAIGKKDVTTVPEVARRIDDAFSKVKNPGNADSVIIENAQIEQTIPEYKKKALIDARLTQYDYSKEFIAKEDPTTDTSSERTTQLYRLYEKKVENIKNLEVQVSTQLYELSHLKLPDDVKNDSKTKAEEILKQIRVYKDEFQKKSAAHKQEASTPGGLIPR